MQHSYSLTAEGSVLPGTWVPLQGVWLSGMGTAAAPKENMSMKLSYNGYYFSFFRFNAFMYFVSTDPSAALRLDM